jgi:transcriptional regulator MraZ
VAQGATGSATNGSVFRGVSHLAIDAKGRLAVPARYRDGLLAPDPGADGQPHHPIVLTVDPSGCLLMYPRAAWEPIQARLMGLSSFNEPIRRLQRLLVGHADDAQLDAAGRILIPPELRQFAALEHRVVLVGQGNRFEVWDEPRWETQTAQAITFSAGALPPELEGFSL